MLATSRFWQPAAALEQLDDLSAADLEEPASLGSSVPNIVIGSARDGAASPDTAALPLSRHGHCQLLNEQSLGKAQIAPVNQAKTSEEIRGLAHSSWLARVPGATLLLGEAQAASPASNSTPAGQAALGLDRTTQHCQPTQTWSAYMPNGWRLPSADSLLRYSGWAAQPQQHEQLLQKEPCHDDERQLRQGEQLQDEHGCSTAATLPDVLSDTTVLPCEPVHEQEQQPGSKQHESSATPPSSRQGGSAWAWASQTCSAVATAAEQLSGLGATAVGASVAGAAVGGLVGGPFGMALGAKAGTAVVAAGALTGAAAHRYTHPPTAPPAARCGPQPQSSTALVSTLAETSCTSVAGSGKPANAPV